MCGDGVGVSVPQSLLDFWQQCCYGWFLFGSVTLRKLHVVTSKSFGFTRRLFPGVVCFWCFFLYAMLSELLINCWWFLEGVTKKTHQKPVVCCAIFVAFICKKTSVCYFAKARSNGVPGRVSGCPEPRQRVHFDGNGDGHRSRLVQQAVAELRWEDGERNWRHHRQTHSHHHFTIFWRHFDGDIVWVESVSGENTWFFVANNACFESCTCLRTDPGPFWL